MFDLHATLEHVPVIRDYVERLPLIAILRGVEPEEVVSIGEALVSAGFAIIEVPLNSPRPFESIRLLADACGATTLVGAGTVLAVDDVHRVEESGGRLIVMPHSDPAVIRAAKERGLVCCPGIATPTEGFAALANGADALKLFPAELVAPPVIRAMRSVFPADTLMFPVGGITMHTMEPFITAGASGFGLGSSLYNRGDGASVVGGRAAGLAAVWRHGGHVAPSGNVMRPLPSLNRTTE